MKKENIQKNLTFSIKAGWRSSILPLQILTTGWWKRETPVTNRCFLTSANQHVYSEAFIFQRLWRMPEQFHAENGLTVLPLIRACHHLLNRGFWKTEQRFLYWGSLDDCGYSMEVWWCALLLIWIPASVWIFWTLISYENEQWQPPQRQISHGHHLV